MGHLDAFRYHFLYLILTHLRIVYPVQSLGLLGDVLEPEPVARFLRHCPGLSKQTIGDLLGENDQFFLDVLDAFTFTFSFRGAPYLANFMCQVLRTSIAWQVDGH